MLVSPLNRWLFLTALSVSLLSTVTACQKPANKDSNQQASTAASSDNKKTLAITAIVDHPAFEAVKKGIIDELANEGFKDGQTLAINYQSAQGNASTAGQIAKQITYFFDGYQYSGSWSSRSNWGGLL